jgi:hypothetical protein
LVGEKGSVVGVDMTEEQLGVAMRYLDWHMERYAAGIAQGHPAHLIPSMSA